MVFRSFRGAVCLAATAFGMLAAAEPRAVPDFNREIRPLLSDRCFHCHGPDEKQRGGDLRLDDEAGLRSVLKGTDPAKSELFRRLTVHDPDERMPPPESGRTVSAAEIAVIRRWIEAGSPYAGHWAFVPPVRPAIPAVKQAAWPRNPIDAFVLARLEKEGLAPSPEADPARLLRRASLDLTGLPPTLAELEAFLSDPAPDAYERAVDRLLASPRYGERMAILWLDAARYADTHGYQKDNERQMWRWRDWVIDAYNRNLPFDRFTVDQLAGDLLPAPTLDQRIATGFNRNHRINSEGGSIPEEFRVEYVVDRVETATTVWLGLTFGCARCHDHKYDPISQKEFFGVYAFFNSVPEKGVDGGKGNAAPVLTVPVPGTEPLLAAAEAELTRAEANWREDSPARQTQFADWLRTTSAAVRDGRVAAMWTELAPADVEAKGIAFETLPDRSVRVRKHSVPTATYAVELRPGKRTVTGLRLETLPDEALAAGGPGLSGGGNFVLTGLKVSYKRPDMNEAEAVDLAGAVADYSHPSWPIGAVLDRKANTGWAIHNGPQPWHRKAVFRFAEPVPSDDETVLTIELEQKAKDRPNHLLGRFRLAVTGVAEPALDGRGEYPADVVAALQIAEADRKPAQRKLLREHFLKFAPELAPLRQAATAARTRRDAVQKGSLTSVMVMQEMPQPRPTFLLERGLYDQPGPAVMPGVPAALGKLPAGEPANRLAFARWLVDPANPLTARVTVNRAWQLHFGTGLVKTAEDFGAQGEWPTHPELLDWLAVEFRESGWDVKRLHRLLVVSATYRQSSRTTPAAHERDPENRLLARGPRFRLPGDAIRDSALAAAGLLVEKIGGPSVKPYQPPGLWSQVAGINSDTVDYVVGKGDDLYRRSLYTFWKRAVSPPGQTIFDASGREICNVRRRATNTPLQALTTLNDVQFVEAARVLGERMLKDGGPTDDARLTHGWRRVLSRPPSEGELAVLRAALARHRATFAADPKRAAAFLHSGAAPQALDLDPAEQAAFALVAHTILNLDEAVTKE